MGLGGRQYEKHKGRRFLQGFQQGIESLVGQHVDFVDDVNLIAGLRRRELHVFPQVADLVDPPVGGGVDLIDIHRRAFVDQLAGTATVAGRRRRSFLAVQRLRQHFGGAGLAGSARSGEQVGMGNPPRRDRVFQCHAHVFLPDQPFEIPRPPLSVQCLVGHAIPPFPHLIMFLQPGGFSLRRRKKKDSDSCRRGS